MTTPIDKTQVAHYIEIRGVYDGWSVAVTHDGVMINRWSEDDGRRYTDTQEWIENSQKPQREDDHDKHD